MCRPSIHVVDMLRVLLGLLLEEREAFDFSDSGLREEQVRGKVKFTILNSDFSLVRKVFEPLKVLRFQSSLKVSGPSSVQ